MLDFGLNTQIQPTASAETVKLSHRIVMNFFTAKLLPCWEPLANVVQAHENNRSPPWNWDSSEGVCAAAASR